MRRTPVFVAALIPVLASCALASPLAEAPSAYVRAHADSPVQFLPWGEAAFVRARAEQKPIYVVVGSFTQELARAMREQSFAREESAAMLNESFIPVVVDRDEHPDLAAFLQAYVGTVKQMQGWPLNLWLTPDLKPFEGASYLPPSDEWGKEGFPNALRRVLNAWQTDPDAQRAKADEALAQLAAAMPTEPPPSVDAAAVHTLLTEATAAWMATYDATNGGFGEPPRRLEAELLRFLLQTDEAGRSAALTTLRAIATSPLRDPIDGGFFRSAGDTAWRQPSLQKTLGDQARIALTYLDAANADRAPALADAAAGALGYALSLGSAQHGFVAAEDGTPESIVPAFFWSAADMRAALGGIEAARVLDRLGITEAGNLAPDAYLGLDSAGKNLPRFATAGSDATLVAALGTLRTVRAKRTLPLRDSLATSGAHGLLLAALTQHDDARSRAAAGQLSAFVREKLILADGRLRSAPGFATAAAPRDYALVIDGLLTFAAQTKDEPARAAALALLARVDALFWDAAAGRYLGCALPLSPGVSARIVAPASEAGDAASAETAMLLALVTHRVGEPGKPATLAAAIAADIRESANPARGDQLLALHAFVRVAH